MSTKRLVGLVGTLSVVAVALPSAAQDTTSGAEAPTPTDAQRTPVAPADAPPTEGQRAPVQPAEANPTEAPPPPNEVSERPAPAPYSFHGWAEAYYAWNVNEPSNGLTNLRGFDNRHNSFNLSNVVLDAEWDVEGVNGRVTLQWGSTPATYYLAETSGPTLGAAVGAQGIELWQAVQQAYVGYRIPVGGGLNVQAGLFLSPIGPEGMNVKDNWNYSRSNLFFGLPFYHTGIRISYRLDSTLTVSLWGINGWNTILDNNDAKSLMLHLAWTPMSTLSVSFSYFSGIEPIVGSTEQRGWRHLFDAYVTYSPLEWLELLAHANGGFEPVPEVGNSAWLAGALYARARVAPWFYLAVRGDLFWDAPASNASRSATRIFWPVEWVSSATATVDLRPHDHVSFRLEYRYDHAAGDAYFQGLVEGDGLTAPYVPNADTQHTITVGTTAWF